MLKTMSIRSDSTIWRIVFCLLLLAGAVMRVWCFDITIQPDILNYFVHYYNRLQTDAIAALSQNFTKLSAAYLYLWIPLTYLPFEPVPAIKATSCLFDFISAYWIYRLARLRYPSTSIAPSIAALLVIFSPAVIINSSLWGQLDSTYTSFLIACIFFLARSQSKHASKHDALYACISYALAFCFKLQSSFLWPALAYFYGKKILKTHHLLLIPLIYALMLAPRLFAGLPLDQLFLAYPTQIQAHELLTIAAPTLYSFIPAGQGYEQTATWLGVLFAGQCTLIAFVMGAKNTKALSPGKVIFICLLSLFLTPLILPRMHSRYFYSAELLSIAAAFYYPVLGWFALSLNAVAVAILSITVAPSVEDHLQYLTLLNLLNALLAASIYMKKFHARADKKYSHIFYIMCGTAAYNRGDRGNLFSQITLLREHFPHAKIVFDSFRPQIDAAWYDATVVKRHAFPIGRQLYWLKKADIVIWGGGALIADNSCRLLVPHWLLQMLFVKKILRKKVMAWAHGIVLETKLGATLGRIALNQADLITVRNQNSFDALQKLKLRPPIHLTADPGILLAASPAQTGKDILKREHISGRPLIAIAPTFWHFYHRAEDWLPYPLGKQSYYADSKRQQQLEQYKRGLAALTVALAKRYNAEILFLPRYPDPQWDDMNYLRDIIALTGGHAPRCHIFDNDSYAPKDYYAMFQCFDLMVNVALHDGIFATALGVPCVHLWYEAKGRDFFHALHADDRLLPWQSLLDEKGLADILTRVDRTMKNWASINYEMGAHLRRLQSKARQNVIHLKALL